MRGGSERLQNLISCLRGAWSACEDRDGDLARLGPVRHGPAPEANDHGAVAGLVPEQRALLAVSCGWRPPVGRLTPWRTPRR